MNIFVGNLLFDATEDDVKKLFEGYGFVASVVIVMSKEKKAPKSRGFGFVQMPDEQQALAAIAAINGKEFMGRVLNVSPARPKGQKAMVWPPIAKAKTEVKRDDELKKQYPREEREQKKAWINPVFNEHLALKDGRVRPSGQHLALKDGRVRPSGQHPALKDGRVRPSAGQPGTYKGGRRTRSYMKRQVLAGMQEEAKPWRRRNQDNPMRWRKRKDQPRPWQKSPGGHKPWEKVEEGARPWKKAEGESKHWRKSEGGIKPWKKPAGDAKPWSKSGGRAQKSRFNPSTSSFDKLRTNPERVKRVEGSLGIVRGNGERSRAKSRKNPGGYKR